MSVFHKRFDEFYYNRNNIRDVYFNQIHPYAISLDTPDTKRFNHMSTPSLDMNSIRKFDETLFENLKKFFNTISKKHNVSNKFAGGFFIVPPQQTGTVVHIDTFLENNDIRQWAFNIPVHNTDNTYHQWVNVRAKCDPVWMLRALWFETNQIDIVEEITLDVPTLVNVSVPHRISNPTDDYRIIFSARGESNSLSYADIEKIF